MTTNIFRKINTIRVYEKNDVIHFKKNCYLVTGHFMGYQI